jgi:hypothetical protein
MRRRVRDPDRGGGVLSAERLHIVTEEDRERLFSARRDAGTCGGCGRTLGAGATVYMERFTVVRSSLCGAVGRECASPALLAAVDGTEPERCAWCGRGVYYRSDSRKRNQAICCKKCANRATSAKQRAKERGR